MVHTGGRGIGSSGRGGSRQKALSELTSAHEAAGLGNGQARQQETKLTVHGCCPVKEDGDCDVQAAGSASSCCCVAG